MIIINIVLILYFFIIQYSTGIEIKVQANIIQNLQPVKNWSFLMYRYLSKLLILSLKSLNPTNGNKMLINKLIIIEQRIPPIRGFIILEKAIINLVSLIFLYLLKINSINPIGTIIKAI